MLSVVERDIPRAILVSLGIAALAVLVLFKSAFRRRAVLGALFLGLSWLAVFMAATGFKINFFNFVQRLESDPEQGVLGALQSSSGPVILCSLTTILGDLAPVGSVNQAIRGLGGLGVLALIGEVVCLLAVVLVLPAALLVFTNRDRPSRPVERAPVEINAA